MTVALETTGLGKRYGHTWALRECTLALPVGRIGALVGPNGAGKTTLLQVAVGLARPDAGSVRVLGQTPVNNTGLLARVGFVAQDTPVYRNFTVAEMVTLGARLSRRFDPALARDRLARLDIPLDRRTGSLSGGQRAQVALAIALAKRPDLLLLDEPVASLDPLARREFLQSLMGAVADGGVTVLLSSHLVGDLERICDYLIVLNSARVQVVGAVDTLLAEHCTLVGPGQAATTNIAGVADVVQASHAEKQTTLLVRTNGRILDPQWMVAPMSLEDLVLAYLANSGAGRPARPQPHNGSPGMIWLTWRQHRAQVLFIALGLALLAALFVPIGLSMNRSFVDTGLAECLGAAVGPQECGPLIRAFNQRFGGMELFGILLLVVPLLVGLFVGATLVAREVEHGTHRLVWTLGVSRQRWAMAKLALILPAVAAVSAIYGLLPYWFLTPRALASTGRLSYLLFDMQGLVPVGYTLFAVTLGVLAGTIWRRSLPAMAATLVGFVAARIAVGLARSSFRPPQERRQPVFAESSGPSEVIGNWVVGRGIYNAAGQKIANAYAQCGSPADTAPPGDICAQMHLGDYNRELFHPASQFWPFQLIETGVFVGLAAVLLAFALHRIRRIS